MNPIRRLIINNARKLLRNNVATFLAGAILMVGFDVALNNIAQRYLGITLIILSLFILYAVLTLVQIKEKTENQIDKLGISTAWIHGSRECFRQATILVDSAQKRILVLSQYAPKEHSLKMPDERPELIRAIEEMIIKRLNGSIESQIIYKRILQTEINSKTQNTKILKREFLNEEPPQTYEHCKKVLEMIKGNPNDRVDVNLFLSGPIASFPSILLVDDRYALISFVPLYHRFGEPEQAQEIIGALLIEDRNGQLMAELEQIFDRISQASHRILEVAG